MTADCTDRPIVLYDAPHRTGVAMTPDTVKKILEHRHVKAIKACVPERFEALRKLPLAVLCGTDAAFLACMGGRRNRWNTRGS